MNNKGFTMVELLVAMAIMGLLIIMAFPTIRAIQTNDTNKKFETFGKTLLSGAKLYVDSYGEDLFTSSLENETVDITTAEMIKKQMVENSTVNETNCSESKVFVVKYGEDYSYCLYLLCKSGNKVAYSSNDMNKKAQCKKFDTVSINYVYNGLTKTDLKTKGITNYTVLSPNTLFNTSTSSFDKWSYGGSKYNPGDKIVGPINSNITFNATFKNTSPSTPPSTPSYTLTFDSDGGSKCDPLKIERQKNKKWGSLCTPSKSGNTFDGWYTAKNGKGTKITGNSTATSNITVYANWKASSTTGDKPTCTITASAKPNGNGWYSSDVKLTLTMSGGTATSYGLDTKKNSTNKKKTVSISKTGNHTYYGFVKNSYGTGECSYTVKLDKTAPTCGKTTGDSTKWTNKDRTIKQACSDKNSGCVKKTYEHTYDSDKKTSHITIKDNAGNTTKCEVNVYVDKTAPVMFTTNNSKSGKKFAYKPSRQGPVSSGVKIVKVKCHSHASNNDDYDENICTHWSWKYTKVPYSNGLFWWGWDHIDCKDKGGSGCDKEYWKWKHDSSQSKTWPDWSTKYDKKFFAGKDRPSYKHGWAKAVDKAGNKSDVFEYYMTAEYNG